MLSRKVVKQSKCQHTLWFYIKKVIDSQQLDQRKEQFPFAYKKTVIYVEEVDEIASQAREG